VVIAVEEFEIQSDSLTSIENLAYSADGSFLCGLGAIRLGGKRLNDLSQEFLGPIVVQVKCDLISGRCRSDITLGLHQN
jgi:hypothetical protein